MVLESADDQWRIPVTFGNFDNSCGVAGVLSGSEASEDASGLALSVTAGRVAAVAAAGDCCGGAAPAGLTGIFSVWIMAPFNCAFSIFNQTPPANAVTMTMNTSSINRNGRCSEDPGSVRLIVGAVAGSGATMSSACGAFSAGASTTSGLLGIDGAGAGLAFAAAVFASATFESMVFKSAVLRSAAFDSFAGTTGAGTTTAGPADAAGTDATGEAATGEAATGGGATGVEATLTATS